MGSGPHDQRVGDARISLNQIGSMRVTWKSRYPIHSETYRSCGRIGMNGMAQGCVGGYENANTKRNWTVKRGRDKGQKPHTKGRVARMISKRGSVSLIPCSQK